MQNMNKTHDFLTVTGSEVAPDPREHDPLALCAICHEKL